MTFFPDSKTFLQIGSLSIAWYAILIITGAFIAYKIGQHSFKKMGYNKDILSDYFFGLLIIGIIGARIWYVIFIFCGKTAAYMPCLSFIQCQHEQLSVFKMQHGAVFRLIGNHVKIVLYYRKNFFQKLLCSRPVIKYGLHFKKIVHKRAFSFELLKPCALPLYTQLYLFFSDTARNLSGFRRE